MTRDRRSAQPIRRRLVGEEGITLTEMMVVLAILGIILTGMTTLFVSASTSQIDQTNRVQAQQEARLALDALRREIHCATAIAPDPITSPASSISLTLGPYCQNSGTTLTTALTIPAGGLVNGTVAAADTSAFATPSVASPEKIYVGTTGGTITCTLKSATNFTGCTGGLASSHAIGTAVTAITTITWCTQSNGASPPVYSLGRYRGSSCGTGSKRADSLVDGLVFTGYPPVATGNRRVLHVALLVDVTPNDAKQRYTLRDDIALRNSPRS